MLGLLSGSVLSIDLSKLRTFELKWAGMSEYFPTIIFLARSWRELALKGGYKEHISYKRTPSDQISLLKLYGKLLIISGDK